MARRTTKSDIAGAGATIIGVAVVFLVYLLFTYWYVALALAAIWALYAAVSANEKNNVASQKAADQENAARDFMNVAVVKKRIELQSKASAPFFAGLVGLTVKECEEIGFDGEVFHLDLEVPLSELTAATALRPTFLPITDITLPYQTVYAYTTKEGRPDLRYSNNPSSTCSWVTTITLSSAVGPKTIKVFRRSNDSILEKSSTCEKLAKLILLSKNPSFHGSYRLYEAEYDAARTSEAAFAPLATRAADLQAAIGAMGRLIADGKIERSEGESKLVVMSSEFNHLDQKAGELRLRVKDAEIAMAGIIKSLAAFEGYKADMARIEKIGFTLPVVSRASIATDVQMVGAGTSTPTEAMRDPLR